MNTIQKNKFSASIKSWIAYDAGNSAFATTVLAAFFPIFFTQYWAADIAEIDSAKYYSFALMISNGLLLISAPIVGAITDISGNTKKLFSRLVLVSIFFTGLLFFLEAGSWLMALVFFGVANLFFSTSNVLYDKILIKITTPDLFSKISGYGYAVGYFGGGTLFLLNAIMSLQPGLFGLESQADAIRWSFLTVSIWWSIFLLPLYINFKDETNSNENKAVLKNAIFTFIETLRNISAHKPSFIFLIAFFLYIDGVHTVMALASTFALNIGLKSDAIIIALIMVQFVAFPATLFWAWVADRFNDLLVIFISIFIYIAIIIYSTTLTNAMEFYILAILVGSVQGGIQASSRSCFAKIIPEEKSGEFFGLFNTFGKAGALFGPFLVGIFLIAFNDIRLALVPIILLFIFGGYILYRYKNEII